MLLRRWEQRIGQFHKKITHVRRFYSAVKNPLQTQETKLMQIIRKNENTLFGRKYHFDRIKSIADYQRYVPAHTYEDLFSYIEPLMNGASNQLTAEDPIMFATTSCTTGAAKYIPITESHLEDYTHAFQVHNYGIFRDYGAKNGTLLIFSSNDEEGVTNAGIPYGAVSGLLRRRQPKIVQKYFTLPHLIGRIKEVELKYYLMLRIAMCHNITAIFGCNPSSFLLFGNLMQEHCQDLLADIFDGGINKKYRPTKQILDSLAPQLNAERLRVRAIEKKMKTQTALTPVLIWPDLTILSCWKGGPLSFYLDRIPSFYGTVPIRDFGYMASEGRGTIPMSNDGAGGVAAITSHFFEFVPEEQINQPRDFLTVEKLVLGARYYIFFTTAGGLYRYHINDLVEVVGFEQQTPIIQFIQKGGGISSITGEKLTEEQVKIALQEATHQLNSNPIEHFTCAVKLEMPPYYVCFIEAKNSLPQAVLATFLEGFENSLQKQNIEYKDKRITQRLGFPRAQLLPAGTFTKLRQQRVLKGAPEAQVKIPLLQPKPNFQEILNELF